MNAAVLERSVPRFSGAGAAFGSGRDGVEVLEERFPVLGVSSAKLVLARRRQLREWYDLEIETCVGVESAAAFRWY